MPGIKEAGYFLMLWQWKKADMWDDVVCVLRHHRVWCINIYHTFFQSIDFCHIMPLLECRDDPLFCPVVFFSLMEKPGKCALWVFSLQHVLQAESICYSSTSPLCIIFDPCMQHWN